MGDRFWLWLWTLSIVINFLKNQTWICLSKKRLCYKKISGLIVSTLSKYRQNPLYFITHSYQNMLEIVLLQLKSWYIPPFKADIEKFYSTPVKKTNVQRTSDHNLADSRFCRLVRLRDLSLAGRIWKFCLQNYCSACVQHNHLWKSRCWCTISGLCSAQNLLPSSTGNVVPRGIDTGDSLQLSDPAN